MQYSHANLVEEVYTGHKVAPLFCNNTVKKLGKQLIPTAEIHSDVCSKIPTLYLNLYRSNTVALEGDNYF